MCTLATFAVPPGANAALLPALPATPPAPSVPKNPVDPIKVALDNVTKTVQDLLAQAGPTQTALADSAEEFQANVQAIVAAGQEDPTTIQPAIQALVDDPTGIVNTTPLLTLALTLAAKAAQPICPIIGALAAETEGVQVPTMPDYSIFGPLADVVKEYDQTGANTLYDFYVQVFTTLLEPIAAPAPADSVVALAQLLLSLIKINWKTTYYPAGSSTTFVRNTPGFLYLPTLIDVDNNLGFDVCANNGFDLLGDQSVNIQIDRIPLADPKMRADIETDFLLNVLHAGYKVPAGSHIPSMFQTTHTLAGQPFDTKVQWPGGSMTQFLNLANAVYFRVNTEGTPSRYVLRSATPAGQPTSTVVTKWNAESGTKKFSYEMYVPNTLLQGIGAANPAPGRFQYCIARSAYCSNETNITDLASESNSMHFTSDRETDVHQYGVLGAAANGAAPTTCPSFALLGDAHLRGRQLHLGYKTGANGKVRIDTADAALSGCTATAGATGVLPAGFKADKRLVTLAASGSPPPALTKTGTATCPSGTTLGTSTVSLAQYFCTFAPSNSVLPFITGDPYEASLLTGNKGTWGPTAQPAFTYQWLRCDASGGDCSNIAGATSTSYTVQPADKTHTLRFKVTGTNLDGVLSATSDPTPVITLPPGPVNTALPVISGTLGIDKTLTTSNGTFSPTPPAFTYQWLRCDLAGDNCVDIAGATSNTYVVTADDQEHTLRSRVTGTNLGGSGDGTSLAALIPGAPVNTLQPAIRKKTTPIAGQSLFQGDRLNAIPGTWTYADTFTYQWFRCDSSADCADIAGATSANYQATIDDVGNTLGVHVTAHNKNEPHATGTAVADALPTGVVLANAYILKAPGDVADGVVKASSPTANNTAFIGGTFDTVGPAVGGAGALTQTSTDPGKAATLKAGIRGGSVKVTAPDGAGGYFAGGSFKSVGGVACNALAHIRSDGTLDATYCQPTMEAGGEVRALSYAKRTFSNASATSTYPGCTTGTPCSIDLLTVGGKFSLADGHQHLMFIDSTGLASYPTEGDPNDAVNAIADFTATTPAVIIGGAFTAVGGHSAKRLGRINFTWADQGSPLTLDAVDYLGGVDCAQATPCAGAVVNALSIATASSLFNSLIVGGTFDTVYDYSTNTTVPAPPATPTPIAFARSNAAAYALRSASPYPLVGSWAPNPNGTVNAISSVGSSSSAASVYLAGAFTQVVNGATTTSGLKGLVEYGVAASPLSSTWNAVPSTTAATTANASPNTSWKPQVDDGKVLSLLAASTGVFLGGSFTSISSTPRHRLAHVSAAAAAAPTVSAWDPNAGQTVHSLSRVSATSGPIFAGGDFKVLGGQTRNNIAELSHTSAVTSWTGNGGTNGPVSALLVKGGSVFAGGQFSSAGGSARSNAAAFDTAGPGALSAWDPAPDGAVNVLTDSPNVDAILVGGSFGNIGGGAKANLAEVTSTGAGTLNGTALGADGPVNAIAVNAGTIFVGGQFGNAGGSARSNLAAFGSDGSVTSWAPGTDGPVYVIVATNDGQYVGGAFSTLGGATRNNVGLVDPGGSANATWDPDANGAVRAMALVGAGSKLFVGGEFTQFGADAVRGRVAQLEADTEGNGAPTESFDGALDGNVFNLVVFGPSGWLGAFGDFVTLGDGKYTSGVAVFGA